MEIRKRAELDVLYPEPQKGIVYDSPELLLMEYISENNTDKAMALFRDKRQFSDDPPAVDTPYGRFEGKEKIREFAEGFIARFEADGLSIVPKFQTRSGGRSVTEMVLSRTWEAWARWRKCGCTATVRLFRTRHHTGNRCLRRPIWRWAIRA